MGGIAAVFHKFTETTTGAACITLKPKVRSGTAVDKKWKAMKIWTILMVTDKAELPAEQKAAGSNPARRTAYFLQNQDPSTFGRRQNHPKWTRVPEKNSIRLPAHSEVDHALVFGAVESRGRQPVFESGICRLKCLRSTGDLSAGPVPRG